MMMMMLMTLRMQVMHAGARRSVDAVEARLIGTPAVIAVEVDLPSSPMPCALFTTVPITNGANAMITRPTVGTGIIMVAGVAMPKEATMEIIIIIIKATTAGTTKAKVKVKVVEAATIIIMMKHPSVGLQPVQMSNIMLLTLPMNQLEQQWRRMDGSVLPGVSTTDSIVAATVCFLGPV
jgi:hypothetical protein